MRPVFCFLPFTPTPWKYAQERLGDLSESISGSLWGYCWNCSFHSHKVFGGVHPELVVETSHGCKGSSLPTGGRPWRGSDGDARSSNCVPFPRTTLLLAEQQQAPNDGIGNSISRLRVVLQEKPVASRACIQSHTLFRAQKWEPRKRETGVEDEMLSPALECAGKVLASCDWFFWPKWGSPFHQEGAENITDQLRGGVTSERIRGWPPCGS